MFVRLWIYFALFFSFASPALADLSTWVGSYNIVSHSGSSDLGCSVLSISKSDDTNCGGFSITGLSGVNDLETQFCKLGPSPQITTMPFDPAHSTSLYLLTQTNTADDNVIQKKWSISAKVGGIFGGNVQEGQIQISKQGQLVTLQYLKKGVSPAPFRTNATCVFMKRGN